jgi:hypothetical protein
VLLPPALTSADGLIEANSASAYAGQSSNEAQQEQRPILNKLADPYEDDEQKALQ